MNFENWTNGEPQLHAKVRVFKVDHFIFPLFFVSKLRSMEKNELKKRQLWRIFSTFGSKINEFEQKKTKKFQKLKSCRPLS